MAERGMEEPIVVATDIKHCRSEVAIFISVQANLFLPVE